MNLKEALIDFCDRNGLEYRTNYSGRYMYGKTCFAIICEDSVDTAMQLGKYLKDIEFDDTYSTLDESRMDSMGLSQVLYFPKVSNE